jgi:hypothetical protein
MSLKYMWGYFPKRPVMTDIARLCGFVCVFCRKGRSWAEVAYVCMLMGAVPWGVNWLLWHVGSKRADAMLLDKTKGVLHQAIEVRGTLCVEGGWCLLCGDIQAPG